MSYYQPLYIKSPEVGLVKNRPDIILPNDAYPTLQNASVFREKLVRKDGCQLLGRLTRSFTSVYFFPVAAGWNFNLLTISGYVAGADNSVDGVITCKYPHGLSNGTQIILTGITGAVGYNDQVGTVTVVDDLTFKTAIDATTYGIYTGGGYWISNQALSAATTTPLETNAEIKPRSVVLVIGGLITLTDQGNGTLTSPTDGNSGTINYVTGAVTITTTASLGTSTVITFSYSPALPVMGMLLQETNRVVKQSTLAFDQKYCYTFGLSEWEEYLPGTVWSGSDYQFFYPQNYWNNNNGKLFWVTNNKTGLDGDPVRYTDTVQWFDFSPLLFGSTRLYQFKLMVPFRNRMLVFNTWEGTSFTAATNYPQRIRWSAAAENPTLDASWEQIPNKAGYIDIPTTQDIVSIGFVRDNLVIYCESSTWQLRYTGIVALPFQLEKVNIELGCESTFSSIQFDKSLLGIGDRGIVSCDSFQSTRMDIKIVDFVYQISTENQGTQRVYGIRNFIKKLAYWVVPVQYAGTYENVYPTQRLVYNYENDSWALFDDSFTCLGIFQPEFSDTWNSTDATWDDYNKSWVSSTSESPQVAGGNQQGFTFVLDQFTMNDPSLSITGVTGSATDAIQITVKNHNLAAGTWIQITGIPTGTPYATLLNYRYDDTEGVPYPYNNFKVYPLNENTLELQAYNVNTGIVEGYEGLDVGTYVGGGQVSVRDNFSIVSRKFNFLEEGQNIQLGYVDLLADNTSSGEFTMNVYASYGGSEPANQDVDPFFNSLVPTSQTNFDGNTQSIQRIYCNIRSNFITIEYTFSDEQMSNTKCEQDVQISAQILYMRRAGSQLNLGGES